MKERTLLTLADGNEKLVMVLLMEFGNDEVYLTVKRREETAYDCVLVLMFMVYTYI